MAEANEQKQVVLVLNHEQYLRLEKACNAHIAVNSDNHEPAHLGFQLGIQHVLKKLRDGFVVGG